jgi:hypothetical protein
MAKQTSEDAVLASLQVLSAALAEEHGADQVSLVARAIKAASLKRLLARALADEAEKPSKDDPLVQSHIRGLIARKWLLEAEGGVLSSAQMAELLGVSRQSVDNWRKTGKLFALSTGKHGYHYPVWQLHTSKDGLLPGLSEVMSILEDFGPWVQATFMLNGNKALGGSTPLSELRRGRVAEVVAAAERYAE